MFIGKILKHEEKNLGAPQAEFEIQTNGNVFQGENMEANNCGLLNKTYSNMLMHIQSRMNRT